MQATNQNGPCFMQVIEGSTPYLSSPTVCRLSESDPAGESRKKMSMPECLLKKVVWIFKHTPVYDEYMLANDSAGVVRAFPLDPEVGGKYSFPAS